MSHDHAHSRVEDVAFSVITVSDTRTEANDISGGLIVGCLEEASQRVIGRVIVKDDRDEIIRAVSTALSEGADAVILCGGSGITSRDVTVDAVRPMFDVELPGFGEEFRRRSVEAIGCRGILSRATAGIVSESVIYCIPGSSGGAKTAMDIILDVTGHLLWEARR